MNKTKLATFFITFVILILITPLIFGKMMNSRFDSMLAKLDVNGYKIKQIKNKSSYLLTDRVFEVKIPGNKLNLNQVDYVDVIVEAKFKNLPVTTVDFNGTVRNIVFENSQYYEINRYIKNKIKFFVTTPDFKVYRYKISPFEFKNINVKIAEINGIYKKGENTLQIPLISLNEKPLILNIENYSSYVKKNENSFFIKDKCNVKGSFKKVDFSVKNLVLKTEGSVKKRGILKFKLSAKMVGIKKSLALFEEPKIKINLKNFSFDENVLNNGLLGNGSLNIKNIVFFGVKLGFVDLNVSFGVRKNALDYNLSLATTAVIAQTLANNFPELKPVFAHAKKEDKKVFLKIRKNKDKLIINDRKIESY